MLKGLEVSVRKFSEFSKIIDYRIEAEYFLKKFLQVDDVLSKNKNCYFSDCFSFKNGRPYVSEEFDTNEKCNENIKHEINVAKIGDVTNKRNITEWSSISIDEFNNQKGEYLKDGDILMTLTGDPPDVGKVNLIRIYDEHATWNQRVARIQIKDSKKILSAEYAFILLSSKYCRLQIERFAKGIRQRNLGNEGLDLIKIPLFPASFQEEIASLVKLAHEKMSQSKRLYSEAENLLLRELDLENFTPKNEAVSIKRLSDTFSSGRLDAEFYQSKYEKIENKIKNYKYGFGILSDFIDNYSTGFPFQSETYTENGIPLIRITNINNGELDLSNAPKIPHKDTNLSPKDIAKENDILISMSGSIGNSCKIPQGITAVINQRIMRITPKNYNFDVLPLMINSIICQMQLEKIGTGGVQTNISASDISKILIPPFATTKPRKNR